MATQATVSGRRVLIARLLEARDETDALFQMIRPEALYDRPIPERHRIVFYVGHLEAFDWNLLGGPWGLASFHPDFDRLFAFGIDPVGGGLPSDRPRDWPRIEEVNAYRVRVRESLDRALDSSPLPDGGEDSFGRLLNVAIEHRLMHAETLAYMFHQMPFERKRGAAGRRAPQGDSFAPEPVRVPAGRATLGLPRDARVFGWDNEFEAHTVAVPGVTPSNVDYLNIPQMQQNLPVTIRFFLREIFPNPGTDLFQNRDECLSRIGQFVFYSGGNFRIHRPDYQTVHFKFLELFSSIRGLTFPKMSLSSLNRGLFFPMCQMIWTFHFPPIIATVDSISQ